MNKKTMHGVQGTLRHMFKRVRCAVRLGKGDVGQLTVDHIARLSAREWRGVVSQQEVLRLIQTTEWGERFSLAIDVAREKFLGFPRLRRKLQRLLRHNVNALLRAWSDSRYENHGVMIEHLHLESMVDFISRRWNAWSFMTKDRVLRIIRSVYWGRMFVQALEAARAQVLALISRATQRTGAAVIG